MKNLKASYSLILVIALCIIQMACSEKHNTPESPVAEGRAKPAIKPQIAEDTFEVKRLDYQGYIMPLGLNPNIDADGAYRPGRQEVYKAEKYLKTYLDSFCFNPKDYMDKSDCKVIKTKLGKYFRQYHAYYNILTGHHIVNILLISPEHQRPLEEMKTNEEWGVKDGGSILFHAMIDLNTGKVEFHDNGWG